MIPLPNLNFGAVLTASGMAKLGQIIIGDLTMAGDNVVIMGSLASGLPAKDRRRVLMLGVGMALAFLITFAVVATQLLKVTGLVFAGGLLLLWVAYNMVRELRPRAPVVLDDPDTAAIEGPQRTKTFLHAAIQIAVADLSMSLTFSVLFMGLAANYVAQLIQRYHWINYIGLAVILWVAGNMIYEGWMGGENVLGLRSVLALG
jgi:predicted tellurium resistance membrane protein TerC